MTEATTPVTATAAPATAVRNGGKPGIRQLLNAANWLTTPLLPEDFLGLVNPLWSAREVRGRVEAVEPEGTDAVTVVIHPGSAWSSHEPGQHVRVGVAIDGVRHSRSYSLSSAPDRPDGRITITVKAVAGGVVSQHLVRRMAPGRIVRLAGPSGGFVLPIPVPERLLFLTAGSGITPVMSMLRSLASRGGMPDIALVHSAATPGEASSAPNYGPWRPGWMACGCWSAIPGPGPGPAASPSRICPTSARTGLAARRGRADRRRCSTGFRRTGGRQGCRSGCTSSASGPPSPWGGGTGGRVRFSRSGREAVADCGTSLLQVGDAAGVLMPSGCRMGICHSCLARLICGRVCDLRSGHEHGDNELIQPACRPRPATVEIDL